MKYKLTDETKELGGVTLHRIQALKDFKDVKAGDLGGWVEKEENLSQEGDCWVFDDAQVFNNAGVFDNAMVYNKAEVSGNAQVYGDTRVSGGAIVYGKTVVINGSIC